MWCPPRSGLYTVALPDGRTQIVDYHANHYDGYVADVKYDGHATYPEYHPAPYKPAPKPVYHAALVVHKPAPVYHPAPIVHKPAPYHPAPVYHA